MPKNWQFKELFNYAIRKTVESGEMDKFKTKWATEGKNIKDSLEDVEGTALVTEKTVKLRAVDKKFFPMSHNLRSKIEVGV